MRGRAACVTVVLLAGAGGALAGDLFDAGTIEFSREVDVRALSLLAVQYRGRAAILDTLAREQIAETFDAAGIDGTEPTFAYLELHLNAGAYLDRPVIVVTGEKLRSQIAASLPARPRAELEATGRIPPVCLLDDEARGILLEAGRADADDFRRAEAVPSVRDALAALAQTFPEFRVSLDRLSLRYSSFLGVGVLRLVPVQEGAWLCIGARPASRPGGEGDPAAAAIETLNALGKAWRARDAARVNTLAGELAETLPKLAPEAYPSRRVRRIEQLYNRTHKATIVWIAFAVALALLILAAGSRRRSHRRLGLAVFAAATLALLAGFVARWALSGRAWYLPPIVNQFEAVTGSALLAAAAALVLEAIRGRTYFALAAAFYATTALLFCFLLPGVTGAGIAAAHGILSSPIMAAHVAVIIVGHGMAGMTAFLSAAYVGVLVFRRLRGAGARPSETLDAIDRSNLIVARLALWTIALGTALGAYWGDFAWGRWWGWDPKETWALMTVLIYVAVIHLRFVTPPRHRGLVTAVGCILGCIVMLFNWIVVNYVISGLHSYA